MHAFGLVENGSYALAEERADVALAMQSADIWAVHAMAHVYEMEVCAAIGELLLSIISRFISARFFARDKLRAMFFCGLIWEESARR